MKLNTLQTIYKYPTAHVEKIATDMVQLCAKVKAGESVLIYYDFGATQLANKVAELCLNKKCNVNVEVRDFDIEALMAAKKTKKNLGRHFMYLDQKIYNSDVVFIIRAVHDSDAFKSVSGESNKLYNAAMKPVVLDYRVNHTRWVLNWFATPFEAKVEGLSYKDYYNLYYKSCSVDWAKVFKEQKILVKLLSKSNIIEFKAGKTNVKMSIKGMTFANSTIDVNYPGSEVFSAPVRESVGGEIYANGKHTYQGKTFKDIYLKIEKGKIVKADAAVGKKDLISILDTDKGSRYFGEVALGTNPALRRPMLNPLLVEKVGGSFHMAIGDSYTFTNYHGQKVRLNNKNKSNIHWDLTVMMLKKYGGGEVLVDGKVIQKNGKFLVRGLSYLNKGL